MVLPWFSRSGGEGGRRGPPQKPANDEPYQVLTKQLIKNFEEDSKSRILEWCLKWFRRIRNTPAPQPPKPEVDQLELAIGRGEIYGFLGLNGAGKSTTIKMLCGLVPPTSGKAYICGYNVVSQYQAAAAHAMLVADDAQLFRTMKVREHLRLVGAGYGLSTDELERRIESLVDLFELDSLGDQYTDTFSGGETEKVALASALLQNPEVLILDEPTMALDAANARLLREVLADYAADGGTILVTTHNLKFAEQLCDRIGIIRDGYREHQGTMEELRVAADCSRAADLETVFLALTESEKTYEGVPFFGQKRYHQTSGSHTDHSGDSGSPPEAEDNDSKDGPQDDGGADEPE